jgi:single-strand DNA-binding protein
MANETVVNIVGNLTGDPELRFTPQGVARVRFTIASTPRMFDKASGEYRDGDALFLNCTAWRDLAEHIAESLSRGSRVMASGRLRLSHWDTDEGEKRSAYGLEVDEIGPSLRFATATVVKTTRKSGRGQDVRPPDDEWDNATPADRTPVGAGAGANTPPF